VLSNPELGAARTGPKDRIKIGVIWDLSVKKFDADTCEFTNQACSCKAAMA